MASKSITMDARSERPAYGRIGYGALRGTLVLAFIGAGIFKMSGHPAAVAEFNQVGVGQWLRYLTATIELTGAVLLFVSRSAMYGAASLAGLCVAAFFAQLVALHGDVIHTIVLAVILGLIAWHERQRRSSQR